MARNSEKAQSMLFRFREAQAADLGIIDAGRTRRPKVITEVDSIPSCEKWRGQTLKEISRKVSKIQDSALSDYQIRDLNDEINKLMREKHILRRDREEIPGGGKGYRYFGRAKELPGVKELFEAATQKGREEKSLENRDDLRKAVDAKYYGYAPDEEDEALLQYEAEKEKEAFDTLFNQGGGKGEVPKGGSLYPAIVVTGKAGSCPLCKKSRTT
ncbi:hypothetical protein PG994_004595 [Apiospora phragmitis]|uniref:Pre-mRNA-splicing factor ISY1 n=1 Tax=Apiospora phragmitis TaxID=2905665 RepID=A0ABR1VR16_9PEZI